MKPPPPPVGAALLARGPAADGERFLVPKAVE